MYNENVKISKATECSLYKLCFVRILLKVFSHIIAIFFKRVLVNFSEIIRLNEIK